MILPKISLAFVLATLFTTCFVYVLSSSDDQSYDLIVNGEVKAKIEGKFSWTITNDSKTEHIVLPDTKNVVVDGRQTLTRTTMILSWSDNSDVSLQKNNKTWILVFDRNVIFKNVQLSKSSLRIGSSNDINWDINEVLVSDPTEAYECSSLIKRNKDGNTISMENVRLQAFDLQNQTFGKGHLCDKDNTTTTTTVAPATTTPVPAKPIGNWTVTRNTFTCIRLISDIVLKIDYQTKNGTNASALVQVSPHAKVNSVNSTCNFDESTGRITANEQILQLQFKVNGGNSRWYLTLNFTNDTVLANETPDHNPVVVYYASLQYEVDNKTFPNASSLGQRFDVFNKVNKTSGEGSLSMFKSDMDHFYRCNAEEKNIVTKTFQIWTKSLRAEAFLPNRTTLLSERVCLTDQQNETSDLVPIITGACLAALVLFVLIAYLIGRARARANTYETI